MDDNKRFYLTGTKIKTRYKSRDRKHIIYELFFIVRW
jgi:hypothetical protein